MMCDGGAGEWREEKFQVVNNMAGRQNGTKNSGKSIIFGGKKGRRLAASIRHAPCSLLCSCFMLNTIKSIPT